MKGKVLAYFFREAATNLQGFVTGDTPEEVFLTLAQLVADPYSLLLMPMGGEGGASVVWNEKGGTPRQAVKPPWWKFLATTSPPPEPPPVHEALSFAATGNFPLSKRDGWVTFVRLFGAFDRHTGLCTGGMPDSMGQLQPTATTAPAPPAETVNQSV
jgi:hypothetical protein